MLVSRPPDSSNICAAIARCQPSRTRQASHVYPTATGRQQHPVASGCMPWICNRDAAASLSWCFSWWQVASDSRTTLACPSQPGPSVMGGQGPQMAPLCCQRGAFRARIVCTGYARKNGVAVLA